MWLCSARLAEVLGSRKKIRAQGGVHAAACAIGAKLDDKSWMGDISRIILNVDTKLMRDNIISKARDARSSTERYKVTTSL